MAPCPRSRSALGAVSSSGLVRPEIQDLYDYGALRQLTQATMMVVEVDRPVVVLGGSQSADVVDFDLLGTMTLRRRRGGGGLVLLQPGDIWVDWWIPATDSRWSNDVRVTSMLVGTWWREVLRPLVDGDVRVHSGPLEGSPEFRVVCFAGRGPGEVIVDERKAVGLSQWRVREGVFLSSVLLSGSSTALLEILIERPPGLREALDHHTISTLGITDSPAIVNAIMSESNPGVLRHLSLTN